MVRIIPVHNFLSQNVGQIEEPTASCTANILDQDMLLLALPSHCVKVYGLAMNQYKLLTVFPTVDYVQQLIHSDKGNYVATLESKASRDGSISKKFVRVYINWEMTGNQYQAMRARIAGRVTPSLNRSLNSLEMIELPLNDEPVQITCCQTTGNLLICFLHEAVIYELKVEIQQTSKHKFFDFESRPWSIKFSFIPNHIEFAEEFISAMDDTNFLLIRLTNVLHEDINARDDKLEANKSRNKINSNQSTSNIDLKLNNNSSCNFDPEIMIIENNKKFNLDFRKSLINEYSCMDWDQLVSNELEEIQRLKSLQIIDPEMTKISSFLSSIKSENPGYHVLKSQIVFAPEINATITTKSNEDSWSENYNIEHLIRIKICPELSLNKQNCVKEYFSCSLLKPAYKRQKTCTTNIIKRSLLRSNKYNIFNGVTCLICTTSKGYLFHFPSSSRQESSFDIRNCQIYSFTAPVNHVALENTALHVLTEAGLESYTLRTPHFSVDHLSKVEYHLDTFPVSLIGLRPFLGVRKLLQASKCLVLLGNDKDTWTFYSLNLPSAEDVYQDILNAAYNHKSSPSTYKSLLEEANIVLKLAKDMVYYTSDAAFRSAINDMSKSHLENLYMQSCAILADHYICSKSPVDWNYSNYYYKIAGLKPHDVLAREGINNASGIIIFLSECLLNLQSGPESDALFQEHNIVEILMSIEKSDLLKLILASPILREYATDKLINMLSSWESDDTTCLARVLLFTQADKQQHAEKTLKLIKDNFLLKQTIENWSWLFDVINAKKSNALPTFSDFASILMKLKIDVFATVLAQIVLKQAVTLDQMIQIFLTYLPSRIGRDGRIAAAALQLFLEIYLHSLYNDEFSDYSTKNYKNSKITNNSCNAAIDEAYKILVRSYLAELVRPRNAKTDYNDCNGEYCEDNKKILFGNLRPQFLNSPLLYLEDIKSFNNSEAIDNENGISIRLETKKLQALLASNQLPEECYREIECFLKNQKIEGDLSFRILCARETEKGMQILMEECPQVLLQFAKDKYTKESEWTIFMQFLLIKKNEMKNNPVMQTFFDKLIKDTAIHVARTMSIHGLQRILPNDSFPALQQYIDISNQVIHADYIKTMIVGTGKHLLCNINF